MSENSMHVALDRFLSTKSSEERRKEVRIHPDVHVEHARHQYTQLYDIC